ncbi:type IX secretion system protein PorQ [Arthrospiribacter ruber]|uniref:Type IX secretion system protein PorQ n=1 Tax=Arthrospiribacter ruber TaxID=2487934 RepID=A0A951IYI5_9BACT|nr:type IX secretion system protein PorQ [Arthrospiribacter ruber]MBW3468727.1 type IX secretion system protein PorQ [Arthrospiribacter ruber]
MKSGSLFQILCLGGLYFLIGSLYGQTSKSAFNFIDNPSQAKLAALGGVNITAGSDPLMFLASPALLDSSVANIPSFHYLNFPGGIQSATIGYTFSGASGGVWGLGLQYMDYGSFQGYDAIGMPLGEFGANEFAFSLGYSQGTPVFRYGANLKLLGSALESYQAYALVFDFGINYHHPEMDLVLGINARNVGFGLSSYLEGHQLQLPSDLRVGGSFKPEHAPFRFHLTLRNLQSREVDFYIPSSISGQTQISTADKVFRRAVFGVEILPSDHLSLRLGYNHLIRKEFETAAGAGAGGFSGGFAFKVKRFELSYARMFYNIPGGSNVFGISTAINEWRTF